MTPKYNLRGLLALLRSRHTVTYACSICLRTKQVRFQTAEQAQAANESRRSIGLCDRRPDGSYHPAKGNFYPSWQLDPQVIEREQTERIDAENNTAWLPARDPDGYKADFYQFSVVLVRDFPPIDGKRRLRVYRVAGDGAFYAKDSLVCCRLTQEGDYHQKAGTQKWFDIHGSETSEEGPRVGGIKELEWAGEETLSAINSLTGSRWLPGTIHVKLKADHSIAEGHIYRWCDESHAIIRLFDRAGVAKNGPLLLCIQDRGPMYWSELSRSQTA